MPRVLKGSQPPTPPGRRGGKRGRGKGQPVTDAGFGWDPEPTGVAEVIPAFDMTTPAEEPTPPPEELLALGLPPEDAAGIQKWHYRALSTMAALVLRSDKISDEVRMKRFGALTLAAARHYPDAAKYDLAQQIAKDAAEVLGRKKSKAAAKLEKAPPAEGARVIPLRRDAEVR